MKQRFGRTLCNLAFARLHVALSAVDTFMRRIMVFFLVWFCGFVFAFFYFFRSAFALISGSTSPSSGWF